jgi:hypothetical protein
LPTLKRGDCALFPASLQPQELSCLSVGRERPHLLRITVPLPTGTLKNSKNT